jgi:putative phosphoesterase
MKIVVIGDSHGNIANIKLVLGFAGKIKAGGLIHCGDWDNLKTVNEVLQSRIPVYGVLGNADIDPEMRKMVKDQWLKVNLGGRKIGIVHNLTISHQPLAIDCDVVFCGHRHFRSEKIIKGVKIISPGALHSIEPSFAVYDTGTNGVEFFDL